MKSANHLNKLIATLCIIFCFTTLSAQKSAISGTVSDEFGPLPGASVVIEGTQIGTSTDVNGQFLIQIESGKYNLKASFVMYFTKVISVTVIPGDTAAVIIALESGISIDEVVTVGSRAQPRSLLETAVPVDVISPQEITNSSQVELGQILQYLAPSFNSTHQTISDGTDHIDPATLRGLGPDQLLVLINGKRRHTSSLLNVNGTVGRGTVGTDFNAIPTAAIDRIEILRDGAAAQYGSDAIAGVVNIILKKQTGIISVVNTVGQNAAGDGMTVQSSANYGFEVGDGGFVNVTAEFTKRESTNRSGDYTGNVYSSDDSLDMALIQQNDFWNRTGYSDNRVMEIGNGAIANSSMFFNSSIPISGAAEFYASGGLNFRKGEARGFYRLPKDVNKVVLELYPHGFSPQIHTDISDNSLTAGVRGTTNGWNMDFSNTRGSNSFDFEVHNSNNASLGTASPTTFYCGGFQYSQNSTNVDASKNFDWLISVNIAFGADLRLENYQIFAGEEASWVNGGDTVFTSTDTIPRNAGTQVFPGFQPQNALDKNRTNTAGYIDVEANLTEKLLLGTAARYELYSDFGSNTTWKVTSRYRVLDRFTVRAGYSTGFRAPSLHQVYFNNVGTQFINGEAIQVGTFNNESPVTKAFEITPLKPELSTHISAGFTAKLLDNLSLTIDIYSIDITDRIVLSGRFGAGYESILQPLNAGAAQFFTNAIDTKTQGLDVVTAYRVDLGKSHLGIAVSANFTETEASNINVPPALNGKEDVLFNREEISRVEVAQPDNKVCATITYEIGKLSFVLRNTRFGELQYIHPDDGDPDNWVMNDLTGVVESRDQVFAAQMLTDVSVSVQLGNHIRWTLGGNNILDVYPDEHAHSSNVSSGRFVYSRRVQQFGVQGAYYYMRLALSL